MAIWYLNLLQENEMHTDVLREDKNLYNESDTPQSEQKNKGW